MGFFATEEKSNVYCEEKGSHSEMFSPQQKYTHSFLCFSQSALQKMKVSLPHSRVKFTSACSLCSWANAVTRGA